MSISRPITKTTIATAAWGWPITDEVNRLTALTAASAWTQVTFQNGWANAYGSSPVQYRKVGDMVQLRGMASGSTLRVAAFTMPTGFRPPQDGAGFSIPGNPNGGGWVSAYLNAGSNGVMAVDGMVTAASYLVNFYVQYSTTP